MTREEKAWETRISKMMGELDECVKYFYGSKPKEWSDEDVRCEAHKALSVLKRLMK